VETLSPLEERLSAVEVFSGAPYPPYLIFFCRIIDHYVKYALPTASKRAEISIYFLMDSPLTGSKQSRSKTIQRSREFYNLF
jgi:hypothetical protein